MTRPELWLSEAWARKVEAEGWDAPLYWMRDGEGDGAVWSQFTLSGLQPRCEARRAGLSRQLLRGGCLRALGRMSPAATEAEWEHAAAAELPDRGAFRRVEIAFTRPRRLPIGSEVTRNRSSSSSATSGNGPPAPTRPYPGYRARRGGARRVQRQVHVEPGRAEAVARVSSPRSHLRADLSQLLLPPDARWQFSGIRLARDASGRLSP